jgi:uncharacterized protein
VIALAASIAALAVGPLLASLGAVKARARAALDSFVAVTIAGVVLLHMVPRAFELAGWPALAVAGVGALAPWLMRWRSGERHRLALPLGISALAIHALLDGAALGHTAPAMGEASLIVTAGVVLHRIPVGLAIWSWLSRGRGQGAALGALALIAAASTIGFVAGEELAATLAGREAGLAQALLAGALLHLAWPAAPKQPADEASGSLAAASGLGALAGLLVLSALWGSSSVAAMEGARQIADSFVTLALTMAPALLIAYVVAGLLYAALPSVPYGWFGRGSRPAQALRGTLLGLPLSICSCGVVPVYRALISRAIPPAAALAFLVAAPEIGIASIIVSASLLGSDFTAIRVTVSAMAAIGVALIVARLLPRPAPADHGGNTTVASTQSLSQRVIGGLRHGLTDVVDHTAPWILVGLASAALVKPLLGAGSLTSLPSGLDVVVFAALGMPAYVCASGATPLAAVLVASGLSPGAALAFLLCGPATNITTLGVLARLHGRRAALAFAAAMAGIAIGCGLAVNALVGSIELPALDAAGHASASLLGIVSLALVTALIAASLLRRGLRLFLSPLTGSDEHHAHDHACGHGPQHGRGCCGHG